MSQTMWRLSWLGIGLAFALVLTIAGLGVVHLLAPAPAAPITSVAPDQADLNMICPVRQEKLIAEDATNGHISSLHC